MVPWATLRVSGADPPPELREKERFGVPFEGHIPDLASFYGSARVVISPVRFGSGVKIKTVEALQFGLPVVSTTVGAEGIDLHGVKAVEITDAPEVFARAVCRLLTDPVAWDARRDEIGKLVDVWSHEGNRGPSWFKIIDLVQKHFEKCEGSERACSRSLCGGLPCLTEQVRRVDKLSPKRRMQRLLPRQRQRQPRR